ncbi:disease resistance protein L6-like [Rhodamnia argentea]|uniref:ADP-ribosyl cyclase/cyclic ADP-ribose hydrolase n=1 Tax=Rhodamnia argentea TaxID=178133 RepID=A0A8B8QH60_9MYRT|nr:disease resistance protein L6-like [Rhodamnia argentea]
MSRRPPPEVFLSFRGPDTRRHFVKFLLHMLTRAGIDVFIDDKDLPKGKIINNELIAAISGSRISIAVISEDYASSKSCLMELKHMFECKDSGSDLSIIPIFYYVDPSDVRHCKGTFKRSLRGHNSGVNATVIRSWKSALGRIGKKKGYHLHENNEG